MHNFYVPKRPSSILKTSESSTIDSTSRTATSIFNVATRGSGPAGENEDFYRVFGLTARILVDAARIAYGRDPDFEFNEGIGEEELVAGVVEAALAKEAQEKTKTEGVGKESKRENKGKI